MLPVESGERREQESQNHPVKLNVYSCLDSNWEYFDERSEYNCGSQGFEMLVGYPRFSFFAHIFGVEEENIDKSCVEVDLPETMTVIPATI